MRYVVTVVGLLAVLGGLAGIKASQFAALIAFGKKAEQAGPPPEVVATASATEQRWEETVSAVGSVASAKGVSVSNDAPGIVTRISFESGAIVKQGDVLAELDASVERAQLASAVARAELAATTANRTRALVVSGALSPAQLDADEAQLQTATKDVDALRAQIARKVVRAPFAGRLGIRAVNLGQYLNSGTPIAVLEAVETVFVDFTLPQQRLAQVSVDLPVRVTALKDAAAPLFGKISAVDPAVDAATRTFKVRASMPNVHEQLRPGMFVDVAVVLPEHAGVVTVPATGIVHAPFGDSVFIVEDKPPGAPGMHATPEGKPVKLARQQFVRTGETRGDFVVVTEGVTPGQEVVIAGAFKLRNGSPVVVDNRVKPTPELQPRPENR